jgi:RNA polymerase sigma-54 factor
VQTIYGTYELKYFFSEALPNDEGEEVSTTIIKNRIKELIEQENKTSPMSDEAIADKLKEEGYNVARRTIAKYREQMKIPVARLRKEL